jgi:hypothetical protein
MAASSISGDFGVVSQMTVILSEGTVTVGTSTLDFMGAAVQTADPASKIVKGEWVALDTDTANTFAATDGMPVVTKIAANVDLLIGQIIDQPRWVKIPTSTNAVWATALSNKWYRVATLQLPPLLVGKVTLVGASTANIVPGATGTMDVDQSATVGLDRMTVVDCANGGSADMFSFHYAASGNATVSLLVGLRGFGTVSA